MNPAIWPTGKNVIFPVFAEKNWQLREIRYNKYVKYALILTLLMLSSRAISSPAEEPPEDRIPILDSVQELLGARANFAANRLDSFFATDRADDEFGRSRIRIRTQYEIRERAGAFHQNQYRINLKLPHLEEKFKYDYYQDKEDRKRSKKKQISRAPITDLEERERLKANRLNEGWIFNSDISVTAAIPPNLTLRARARKNLATKNFIHRFVEQFTYRTDERGLIEETRVDSDHIYSADLIFRFINDVIWEIQNEEFRTNHGPTLLHRVTVNDAFNYGVSFQTVVKEGAWYISNYRLSVNYRRNIYKQFVYWDLTPGLDFPKQWSFRRTPFIFTQVEFLFGG
jgi:hypothetical protein